MHIVLLSGGSGKRLWPLSNGVRSKQFLKIFSMAQCKKESMLQRVYRQLQNVLGNVSVTVATEDSQVSAVRNQLPESVTLSVEPCRRDTFPAILLSAFFLRDVLRVPLSETVIVFPVDPYVEETYFSALKEMAKICGESPEDLVLMGIQPTYPSEKYGYILLKNNATEDIVSGFREKPSAKEAAKYIEQGALWNGGVFAFRLGYILERATGVTKFSGYEELRSHYHLLPKISFDYAITEHEKRIQVVRYTGIWKDLGTWNTLTEAMTEQIRGNVILDEDCQGVHAINELGVPLLCMGIRNAVVCASPDGILVADKVRSSYIKPYVEKMTQPIMYAEKSWGTYQVIDVGSDWLTIKVILNPGHGMNYHSHEYRDELWIVVEGEGEAVLDGRKIAVRFGDRIEIPRGTKHLLRAVTALQAIEIQLGKDITVKDKTIHDDLEDVVWGK